MITQIAKWCVFFGLIQLCDFIRLYTAGFSSLVQRVRFGASFCMLMTFCLALLCLWGRWQFGVFEPISCHNSSLSLF
jgi:hypothetical protein